MMITPTKVAASGVDLRQHEAIADHLEQHAADDRAERAADAAREIRRQSRWPR